MIHYINKPKVSEEDGSTEKQDPVYEDFNNLFRYHDDFTYNDKDDELYGKDFKPTVDDEMDYLYEAYE